MAADEGLHVPQQYPLRHADRQATLVDTQSEGLAHTASQAIDDPLTVEDDLAGLDGRSSHAWTDSLREWLR